MPEVKQPPDSLRPFPRDGETVPAERPYATDVVAHHGLALWSTDAQLALHLESSLAPRGYSLQLPLSPTDLLLAVRGVQALLLDLEAWQRLGDDDRAGLAAATHDLPVLCLGRDGGLASRLQAVRLGARGYLTLPLDSALLLDTLERMLCEADAEPGRVLIVDDSTSSAAFHTRVLERAGLRARAITDPMRLLDALQELPPDLILMDIYMPGASGDELVRVLRQQEAWQGIPVVYLSAESDPARQRQAMAWGGDEFLEKTLRTDLLVSAVKARIARYRQLRRLMVWDSRTGLLNPVHFKERLRLEIARCRRTAKPLTLAWLDIDRFKQVNDNHGQPTGDRALRGLARLLRLRLRDTDLVSHFEAGEFALVLPETAPEQALVMVDNLKALYAALPQSDHEAVFHCSLSAGLASMRPEQDGDSLIDEARRALHAARRAGSQHLMGNAA